MRWDRHADPGRRPGRLVIRLAVALFAIQTGFHGFTAALPLALARAGVPDPEIGLIVGAAAVVQIPAAFLAGALVDRVGGLRMLAVGGLSYLVGSGLLLVPGVEAGGDRFPFLVARLFQGMGIASTLPAALSVVPRLVPPDRHGFALAVVGSAHNLTLVVLPPLSLIVLERAGLDGVAWTSVIVVTAGLVTLGLSGVARQVARAGATGPRPGRAHAEPDGAASRRFGFAFRSSWARPVLTILLYVAHWGIVVAYLPQRAEAAGADIGLFFAADGAAVLALRVPSGWLADRFAPRPLVLAGIAVTGVSVSLLLLPPTTPILVASGIIGGAGAGLLLTPLLVEMSRRSTDADRGSAFALFSGALAGALALGSIGAAPIVAGAGFEAAIAASMLGLVAAAVITAGDRALHSSRATA